VASAYAEYAFLHPPSGLIPYLPFVLLVRTLGLAPAAAVWTIVDLASLVAAVLTFARVLSVDRRLLALSLLFMASSNPVSSEIAQGQVNGIVLLFFAVAVARLPRRDAGLLIALALSVKPVAGLVLLVPLIRREIGVFVTALVALIALNAVFVPLIGIDGVLFYAGSVLPYFASFPLRNNSNTSLPFVLQTLFGPPVSRRLPLHTALPQAPLAIVLLWSGRIAVALIWLRTALERRLHPAVPIAVAVATLPFLSSTIWPHYLIFLFPLALALIASRDRWLQAAALAGLFAFVWRGPAWGLWIGILILWAGITSYVIRELRVRPSGGLGRLSPAA
jgi:hypothetical protein